MALEFDEEGMVDRKQLTPKEIKIFAKFLRSEAVRHQRDIDDIEEILAGYELDEMMEDLEKDSDEMRLGMRCAAQCITRERQAGLR